MAGKEFSLKWNPAHSRTVSTVPACRKGRAHHWLLEEPEGGVTRAQCKICKRKRTYQSYLPAMDHGVGILSDPLPRRTLVNVMQIL